MAFASFCGLLTLQVGMAVLATVFFVIGALTLGVNAFDYHENPDNSWPVEVLLVSIFVVLMILAGIIVFMAAYNEDRKQCLAALLVIGLVTLYWLVLTILSLVNSPTDYRRVCVDHRCGESFWLISLNYYRRKIETDGAGKLGVNYDEVKRCLKSHTSKNSKSLIHRRTLSSRLGQSAVLTVVTKRSKLSSFTDLFTTAILPTDSLGTTNLYHTTLTNTNTIHSTNIDHDINTTRSPGNIIHHRGKKNVLVPPFNVLSSKDKRPKSAGYNGSDFNFLYPTNQEIESQQKFRFSKLLERLAGNDYEFDETNRQGKEKDKNRSRRKRETYTHKLGLPLVGAFLFASTNLLFFIFSITMVLSFRIQLKTLYYYDDARVPSRNQTKSMLGVFP